MLLSCDVSYIVVGDGGSGFVVVLGVGVNTFKLMLVLDTVVLVLLSLLVFVHGGAVSSGGRVVVVGGFVVV